MTFPAGWARKCAITIDAGQVAGSGTHADFPVCLTVANLPSEMLDKDGSYPAQMGGGDIRFSSDSAGTTPLPCHVLEFFPHNTPASATALIYVGVDVAGTNDTTIYVWYSTATTLEQPKYNANTDADGFQGSNYVWANYVAMYALGGFGGLRNLKVGSPGNLGRRGTLQPKAYIVAERASGNDYISFPSLVRIGERLYCGVREGPAHTVDVSGSVGIYYSDNLGKTWAEDTGLALTDASYDLRDPKLFAQSDGTLWVFYTKTNAGDSTRVVNYRKASSPYTSWGTETVLSTPTRASSSGKVIELASGRIIAPCREMDPTAAASTSKPLVYWSDNDGTSWTADYLTSDGTAPATFTDRTEFSVAEDPATPGNLVAIMRRDGQANLYRLTSTDSGEAWSAEASNIAVDGSAPDMPEIQYCQDGDLILTYAKDRAAPEYLAKRSADHGATWETDVAWLYENSAGTMGEPAGYSGSGGYTSFIELYKGTFAAVYYHDNGDTGPAKVWCTHFTKVEDGILVQITDTTLSTTGKVLQGASLDDTQAHLGNGAVSFFNSVHNAGAFTISGWAKFNQLSDEAFAFFGSSTTSGDRGFFFAYENRTVVGSPDGLRLLSSKGDGVATVNQTSAAISCDTNPHRFAVICDAAGTPTFIKDATTYSGSAALTNYAGDSENGMYVGGCAYAGADLAALRLDGWMEMWGLSTVNLGADYEATRYANENAPGTFAAAGSPASAAAGLPTLSAPTAVPGSILTTGWRPRFTATY